MRDEQVMGRINELANEEHELYERASHGELGEPEHARLRELGVLLDQCWDLLHQRRALRDAGADPDRARVRDERVVEGYEG